MIGFMVLITVLLPYSPFSNAFIIFQKIFKLHREHDTYQLFSNVVIYSIPIVIFTSSNSIEIQGTYYFNL